MRARALTCTILSSAALLIWSPLPASAQDVRAGVEQLASQIAKTEGEGKQLRVAVADFPDLQGVTSDLGRFIASRLTTRLAQSPRFSVVERQRLGQVLAELKFSMSDLVDPAKAKQLGRMAGVEAIVVGTVADLGNQVDLDARVIDIETNRMLLGATTTISKDQVVKDMMERGRIITIAAPPEPGSGPTSVPASPSPAGKREFVNKLLRMQVVSAEVDAKGLTRVALLYTNLYTETTTAYLDKNNTYVVDTRGNRYNLSGSSLQGYGSYDRLDFQPEVPTRIWLIFDRGLLRDSSFDLYSRWSLPWNQLDVTINDVRIGR